MRRLLFTIAYTRSISAQIYKQPNAAWKWFPSLYHLLKWKKLFTRTTKSFTFVGEAINLVYLSANATKKQLLLRKTSQNSRPNGLYVTLHSVYVVGTHSTNSQCLLKLNFNLVLLWNFHRFRTIYQCLLFESFCFCYFYVVFLVLSQVFFFTFFSPLFRLNVLFGMSVESARTYF